MPSIFLTRYRLVVNDLKDLAYDVKHIALDTEDKAEKTAASSPSFQDSGKYRPEVPWELNLKRLLTHMHLCRPQLYKYMHTTHNYI